jgi:hypothetical protein
MPKEWWEDPYEPPEYSYSNQDNCENNGSPDADNDDDRDED